MSCITIKNHTGRVCNIMIIAGADLDVEPGRPGIRSWASVACCLALEASATYEYWTSAAYCWASLMVYSCSWVSVACWY